MLARSVLHQAGVGEYDGVHFQRCGCIERLQPTFPAARLRVGVDRQQHLRASAVGVIHSGGGVLQAEIETRKIAGVGVVAKSHVDAVRAVVHRGP